MLESSISRPVLRIIRISAAVETSLSWLWLDEEAPAAAPRPGGPGGGWDSRSLTPERPTIPSVGCWHTGPPSLEKRSLVRSTPPLHLPPLGSLQNDPFLSSPSPSRTFAFLPRHCVNHRASCVFSRGSPVSLSLALDFSMIRNDIQEEGDKDESRN